MEVTVTGLTKEGVEHLFALASKHGATLKFKKPPTAKPADEGAPPKAAKPGSGKPKPPKAARAPEPST